MSAGLPVIASDFPFWRPIVLNTGCGLLVDPLQPSEIAKAMCWLSEHPEQAAEMGAAGRATIIRNYSWENEFQKLIDLYKKVTVNF